MNLLFAILGLGQGMLSFWLLNHLPASWFTEIGEEDSLPANEVRWHSQPWFCLSALVLAISGWLLGGLNDHWLLLSCYAFVLQMLWMICLADGKYQIIPDQFTLVIAVIGLALRLVQPLTIFQSVLPAVFFTAGLPWLFAYIWTRIRKVEAMGMGDFKLLTAFAFLFGWPEASFVLFISILSAGFYFMILLLLQKLKLTDHSPLGPFFSLGAAAWLLFPDFFTSILTWYVSLF